MRRLLIAVALASVAFAQGPKRASVTPPAGWKIPRTTEGDPDFQGVWTNVTVTPFERPNGVTKATYTEEEARAYERQVVDRNNADRRGTSVNADVATGYNDFWYDRGNLAVPTLQTSLIVDPPDGRIPAFTPDGQRRQAERLAARNRQGPADGPESRSLAERCIVWTTGGPPMLPGPYNNNYQIVQGPGYVAILVEMIHDVRIIPTDGRAHPPSQVRQWMGHSIGRWEGDTLVVETTNFREETAYRGTSKDMKLIERFTRVSPEVLMYEFTVDDPATFARPWTARVPMTAFEGPIFEYACNEGNLAMEGMLAGARAEEKQR